MIDTIEVLPYNPLWPKMFEDEAQLIQEALGSNCIEIHHIGSTSVPKLSAKPIIDILPVVEDILAVDKHFTAMASLGYISRGEHGILFRRFFLKGNTVRTHHVHIFEKNNPEIKRHLSFRDWLRTYSDDRNAYAELKIDLGRKFLNDRTSYSLGKENFIDNIHQKIGYHSDRIVHALTPREWKAVRHFRQKYFFDKVPIEDPYTWTFKHSDHFHLVLYYGTNIIGYAHIQLWADNRSALRIIVIDEPYQNKHIGSDFLVLIEKWLTQKGIKKLQIQARKDVLYFYARHHYSEMPFNDPDNHETDPNDIEIGKVL